MKIISYNVLDGFEGDGKRKVACAKWIESQSPNIVVLLELNNFTESGLSNFAASFGHKYSQLFIGKSDYRIGITSSEAISKVFTEDSEASGHGLLQTFTCGINILATHLSPISSESRIKDIGQIIQYLDDINSRSENFILAGDFNCLHENDRPHYESTDSEFESFFKNAFKKKQPGRLLPNGELDYEVTNTLAQSGAIDLLSKHQDFFQPTLGNRCYQEKLIMNRKEHIKGFDLSKIQSRIDYIWSDQDLASKCTQCYVDHSDATSLLSDHNPVIAEFTL